MLKFEDNPPVLTPRTQQIADLTGRWWIAHTKARFEKAFAWDLVKRDVAYFLPMVERVTISGGRKRRLMMPLFPSYVFFCGDEEARYTAMATDRLCQVIPVADQAQLQTELRAIDLAIRSKAPLDSYAQFAVGARCRIKAGPLMGIEGKVVERRATSLLVLEVSLLGRGAVLEIDTDLLESLD